MPRTAYARRSSAFALDMFGFGHYTLPMEKRQALDLFPTSR
jgi:hypothetical protein